MSVQGNNIFYGHFTSDGNPTTIELPGPVNFYYQMNWTQWNSVANPGVLKRAWFHSTMPNGSYLGVKNTDGAATDESIMAATNGFTPVDPRIPQTFAATAITAVTQANPAQITSNAHGLAINDLVKLSNVTGMQQISNYIWRVRSIVDVNNFTIFLDSSGFAAAGTGGTATRILEPDFFTYAPPGGQISGITQAANAVVTLAFEDASVVQVGAIYRFTIPPEFGMTEMNGLLGTVTAVSAANNTMTVNINSAGFTAFAFPASGAVPFSPPIFIPAGATTPTLTAAMHNITFIGLQLGTAVVGANGDDIKWVASTRELLDVYN